MVRINDNTRFVLTEYHRMMQLFSLFFSLNCSNYELHTTGNSKIFFDFLHKNSQLKRIYLYKKCAGNLFLTHTQGQTLQDLVEDTNIAIGYFLEKNPQIFRISILPLEILEKTKLYCPLEIPQNCYYSLKITKAKKQNLWKFSSLFNYS